MTNFFNLISGHKFKILGLLFILLLVVFLYPVYGFFSHRDTLPLSPFGWIEVPDVAPSTIQLLDARYAQAGESALDHMEARRALINAPSLSAAVAMNGKLVWAGTTGWADLKTQTPATPATRYRIGSTSKAITATALARLVDAGLMDLDGPISHYVDDLPNPAWYDLTARQLASHMAGIAHYGQEDVTKDWAGFYHVLAMQAHYSSMKDALEVFDGTTLRSTPGSEFYYSSQGTVLLGAVMAGAAGKSYLDLVKKQVLGPNAMTSTIVAPGIREGADNLATFYKRRDQNVYQGPLKPWRPVDLSHRLPAGGFASTPSDLVKMGAAWLDSSYISAETRATFWTHQRLTNGELNPQHYAIGWRFNDFTVEGVGTFKGANHGGVSRGAQSWLMVIPEHNMVVAINTNIKTGHFPDFGMVYKDIVREFLTAIPK